MQSRKLAVVVNASGGRASREGPGLRDQLAEAFAAHGAPVEPQMVEGKAIAQTIADLCSAEVIAVGGGDGTQGSAAARCAAPTEYLLIDATNSSRRFRF